jgi:hypothetical protein
VPALSMVRSILRSLAVCLSTASPIGERQMLPRQTMRTLGAMIGIVVVVVVNGTVGRDQTIS